MLSGTDYYAFGSPMRVAGEGAYRYGFNGKEKDNDVKGGEGTQQDYGMRIYDPRLGRFLSVDPITASYPMLTPYQFSSKSPIINIDLDGLEGISSNDNQVNYNKAFIGGPVIANLTKEAVKKGVVEVAKVGARTVATSVGVSATNIAPAAGLTFALTILPLRGGIDKEGKVPPGYKFGGTYYQYRPNGVDITANFEKHTTDAAGLSDEYLKEVENRINTGKGTAQDWFYLGEITKRRESGSLNSTSSEKSKFAFGFENHARSLANKIRGNHLMDFKGDWKGEFLNLINDDTKELHFSLDDLEGSLYSNILDPKRSNTNWELNTLYQNKEAFERTIFHVGDKTYTGSKVFDAEIP
jgi:RHS repeat-associated protein